MKKVLSMILSLILVVSLFPMGAVTLIANAEMEDTDGYYTYTVSNGKATITGVDQDISGKVTIPSKLGGYTVTRIGEYAFAWCENLTSVTIPNSVTSIGESAFYGCYNLKSVTIPYSVTSIGEEAFYCCESLTSIDIPDSVARIGYAAFGGCLSLEKITLPFIGAESDGNINTHFGYIFGGEDFYDNYSRVPRSLKEVVITKATSTGEFAFYGCSSLESVVIHDGVTSIDYCAFSECVNLTSVTIPNSVTSIGTAAFEFCESLTSITIPDSVISISGSAFYETGYYYDEDNWEDDVLYIGKHLLEVKTTKSGSYTIKDGTVTICDHAFSYCDALTSVNIPDGVISIGRYAFSDCTNLVNINIPNSVTNIYDHAFSDCTSLASVTIPNSVTYIEERTFQSCESLTSITIPDSVTSISVCAFSSCTSLTNVTIGKNVTSISSCAFSSCTSLTNVTLSDSITNIDEYAFDQCTSLTDICYTGSEEDRENIVFEEGNDYLLNATWHYNVSPDEKYYTYTVINGEAMITEVDPELSGDIIIPSTLGGYPVTRIGECAFAACKDITGVIIPDSVTTILPEAFSGCTALTSITIPDTMIRIGGGVFFDTGYYNNEDNWEDNVLYIGKHLVEVEKSISGAYVIKNGTLTIAVQAFGSCTDLTSITIPDSVKKIGDFAFSGCENLESIILPDSVIDMGWNAFMETGYYYNDDNWEDGVLYIGKHLIATDSEAVSGDYAIKEGTVTIATDGFAYCEELTEITIPNSVKMIGFSPFSNCNELESITVDSGNSVYHSAGNCLIDTESKTIVAGCKNSVIPTDNSVTSIGDSAFYCCKGLTSITIPDNITSIGSAAFYWTGITSITIPDSVTSVGDFVFSYCENLTSITIPDSVTSIGSAAFDWTGLTSITIPDSVTSIGDWAFHGCESLENITLSNSVTRIDEYTFYFCTNLTSITIPDGVTSIGEGAFSYCKSLSRITIPDSVTSIDAWAFEDCTGLTDVWYTGSEEDRENIVFEEGNDYLEDATWHYNTCADKHSYTDCFDATCSECEFEREITGHTFDNDCDPTCNDCDFERETGHIYGDDGFCDKCGQPEYIIGDVDGDGELDDWDGVVLARYLADWDVEISVLEALDIDGNGEITDWDGVMLDRYLAGWDIQIG